ncbi:hypothetical protein ES288_D03G107100v1 [Gossypium darwinii]|uniref:DUF7356 domain-containing protein n=1 Tax=Gossypium darwinii TaxID=34276 RepID=A0A5D2D7M8_GOSDA|nr:hypothetical protein ES288_D03G107100v1 [Gossypium darwinii]
MLNMERNYVLLMGFFLLLVAVDCSGSDPKGNEQTGLNQKLDGTVELLKENGESKSVSDSIGIKNLKGNGGDQTNGSKGDIGSDTSKSNLKLQSGSNGGENLVKDGKDSSSEAEGNSDNEQRGDIEHKGREESHVEAGGKTDSGEGDNVQKAKQESHFDAGGKADGGKGDNEHKGKDESRFEAGGKVDSTKGDNEQKGKEESQFEARGKADGGKGDKEGQESKGVMDGAKEGDNEQKGQKESNLKTRGETNGAKEVDNVQKGLEESKHDNKGNTDGEIEGNNVQKGQEKSNIEAKEKTDGEEKGKPDDSENHKEVKSEKDKTQNLVMPPPPPTWKDGFRGEECDPSNMCMDKNKRFAACLRVPGNESPDLSLLIQNKGKGALAIKISAPAFVRLEKTDVQIQEKQDRKVKVSIEGSGIGNMIVLKDGKGECSLDFKELIVHNSATSYVNFLSQTPTTAFIFLAAIMILASGWMCMSFRRKILASNSLKYRRLDMELPVSVAAKAEPERDVNDGWDNSWGDDWDDEEAPMTPSKPVTPGLSSKGLASRRLSKEGWKD